jgi:hypothetical protein
MAIKKEPKYKMDSRCPRQLNEMPDKWCELAVLRLKAIRNAGRELTEEEEGKLPGCPWAIDHQLAHYCFFKYIAEFTSDKPLSDIEMAALLNVSTDTVKKTEKVGITKIRQAKEFSDLRDSHGDGQVVDEGMSEDDYKIYR